MFARYHVKRAAGRIPVLDIRKIIAATCDAIAETLYPTRCVGCDDPGTLLCPSCENALPRIDLKIACPRCGAPFGAQLCTECPPPGATDTAGRLLPPPFSFDAARCATSYEGVAKQLVSAYKDGNEQRLAAHIADEICRVIAAELSWVAAADLLVPVPPTPSHLRLRGWNPLGEVADLIAKQLSLPLAEALVSAKAKDQRKLDRATRAANRSGSIFVNPEFGEFMSQAPTIVVLDDVLTTGATCNAAAQALKGAGAARVFVATYARVW